MGYSSHITNFKSSANVRTFPADIWSEVSHNRNVARRGIPKGPVNWYLKEWMEACGLTGRGAQTEMMRRTDWSKATMSQLYNGTQDYSPKILKEAAKALNAEDWELLMLPARAMAFRGMKESAITIAADNSAPDKPEPSGDPKKTGTNN